MTCNFFSPSHINPYAHAHVNTSCLPTFPPAYTSCMPTPAFHSFHNHYDSWHNHCAPHGHHHDTGNTMVLNMCTPCCPQPKPEEKKPPLDLSKLAITTNPVNGDILDAKTKEPTGQNIKKCVDIIQQSKNDLEISSEGKLIGGCDNNSSCKACMDAINKSVSDVRPDKSTGGGDKTKEVPSGAPAHDDIYDSQDFSTI